MPERFADFDIAALYDALDAQRMARGLSWQAAVGEINSGFAGTPARPVSASTVTGMRGRANIEGDGVLQMLLWLGRTPESFVPGNAGAVGDPFVLPGVDARHILRFDAKAIHAALDAQRSERGMTWAQVADEIGGVQPAGLTRLAAGGRVAFPHVMRVFRWLDRPAASFTRASEW
jgi:hypothetical protein